MTSNLISLKQYAELGVYSEQAIRAKIKKHHWLLNEQYYKAKDGRIFIDIKAVEHWIKTGK